MHVSTHPAGSLRARVQRTDGSSLSGAWKKIILRFTGRFTFQPTLFYARKRLLLPLFVAVKFFLYRFYIKFVTSQSNL